MRRGIQKDLPEVAGGGAAAGLALGGCSALGAFNALIPQDGGTTLVARNLAYGPNPRQKLDIYAPANAALR